MTAILLIQLCLSFKVRIIPSCNQIDKCNIFNDDPINGFVIDHSNVSKVYEYFEFFSEYEYSDILEIYGQQPDFIFDFDLFPHSNIQIDVIPDPADSSPPKYIQFRSGSRRKGYISLNGRFEILGGNLKTVYIYFMIKSKSKQSII
jgi:hypothetical protein